LKISNEVKVGFLVTVALVLLVLGYNLMRGKNIFSRERIYYVRYDNAGGIAPAGHVRYKGMNVGHVFDIELAKDGTGKIVVSIAVMPDIRIPKGSVATIISPDFISAKAVQIEFSKSNEYLESGDTLAPGYVANGLQEVQSQAEALIASMDSAISSISSIFNSETKQNLQNSVKSIESTLRTLDKSTSKVDIMLSENVGRLQNIFQNIESITSNLSQNQDKINTILENLSAVSDSVRRSNIAATIRQANDALLQASEVMNKINSGQGSLGLLVNDDKLYKNLEASSKSLDALAVDLKANPGRYVSFSVFGKKDKSEKKPADQ